MSERGENYKLEERGRSKAESEQAMAPSEAMARPWECDGAGAGVAAGARAEAGSLHSFSSFIFSLAQDSVRSTRKNPCSSLGGV